MIDLEDKLICPNCGGRRSEVSILASNPPQYEYQCYVCLWGIRYIEREDSKEEINQKELNKIYESGKGRVY